MDPNRRSRRYDHGRFINWQPRLLTSNGLHDTCLDKPLEERVRGVRSRPKLGVELTANKPWVIAKFGDLNKAAVRRLSRECHPGGLKPRPERVIELQTVAVTLLNQRHPVGSPSATLRRKAARVKAHEQAIEDIYHHLRPGDPPSANQARNYFNNLFFNEQRYDLSDVGRMKVEYKFARRKALMALKKQGLVQIGRAHV